MSNISGVELFNWLNTNKKVDDGQPQVLDAKEVEQAKKWGFSLFELKENMTYNEFEKAYQSYIDEHENGDLNELNQQEYNIHVKVLQLKYGTDMEPEEGEDIESFEARIKEENPEEGSLQKLLEQMKQNKPNMGINNDNNSNTPQRWSMPAGTRYAVFDYDEARKTYL